MVAATPTFSLIVNTTDRANPLQTLLRALEQQTYPHFEVVVVVGPTRDNTLEILSEYDDRVRVLRCPEANLSQSRNIGLLAARGDFVAFIDDDAVPCQRWLEQLGQLFEDPTIDATGGVVYAIHPHKPLVQHRIGVMSALFEHEDVRSSWLEHLVPSGEGRQWVPRMMGTNMAFRREPLVSVGGFDEFFIYIAEETDVMWRMMNAGYVVHPVKEAPVYHIPASSRHRVVYSYNIKWWLQTRSGIYFSIKNGKNSGESSRDIAMRCLHLFHGHWIWYAEQWRKRNLSFSQFWRMRFEETRAALVGTINGLFRPRQVIDQTARQSALATNEPILAFQNSDSARQPSVDPISGRWPLMEVADRPLRVCLLSHLYPPDYYDGVGRLTNLMARGLFECGHTVHVVTHGEEEQVAFYDGAYVHKIPYRTDRYRRYQRIGGLFHALNYSHAIHDKVIRLKLNDGIQVVDSPIWQYEGLVTAVSGITPVVVRLVTTSRQVSAFHNERGENARLMAEMERALIERADHVLPNTKATLELVRAAYDVPLEEDRCTIIPYGIVPAGDEDARPFDTKKTPDTLTVLYVGRLEKRKGTMDLFHAIPLVLEQMSNVRFVLAGQDNSQHDGFLRKTGMDYPSYFAKHYGKFASRVTFTGMVEDEALQSLYQSCDLFIAPSLYESFGLIYLEAMNYAKPVIGCHVGGVPEVVEHDVTGLLVDPEAPAALAEAMLSMLRAPSKLREMGIAGRQRLLEQFTYIQMARRFEKVYRAVIRDSTGDG
jgi:glycogen(starch) synthase